MLITYWIGTAGEFQKLSFKDWLAQSFAKMAIANASKQRWQKLEVTHL